MGDGGFWHNGLTSGLGNAVFNNSDNVNLIIDNGYAAATGGQDVPSSQSARKALSPRHTIEDAARGVGVRWLKTVRTYDIAEVRRTLKQALTTPERGPKVIIAQSECQLNRQRRIRPQIRKALADGRRVEAERFGVDPETCTGDHSCIRLSGCPSLTVRDSPDPLRRDPVAFVDHDCVGCGVCGEVSHAAVLCPSFYKAQLVSNPRRLERWVDRMRSGVIRFLQSRGQLRRAAA